ncbi:hypothetical protein GGS23DRAFT_280617 [Durotheca rogersii]|uniref:uncharacterized protein n=1 Tax=Durotheca rogersii TaxID=419775 RepID=UPI00221F3DEC|nr:uncharacterized protein GGS23DRAFT_280617 [Durotheca rogersii]KAI5866642.1 hypothetical protein GGS23DRAFT_280617 [Durotheca rogersii]
MTYPNSLSGSASPPCDDFQTGEPASLPTSPGQWSQLDNIIGGLLDKRQDLDINDLLLSCNKGDTLVVVNFPANFVDCKGAAWTSKRFLVDSSKLLGTGSSVFANLLSPQSQTRFRRRMENAGESLSCDFVVDLTPPDEGDELAAQIMELSLPVGVRDWWISHERLGISPELVSGHDDHCPHHDEVPIDCERCEGYVPSNALPDPVVQGTLDLDDIKMSPRRMIEEYCSVRHRANIIRLVLAIQGYSLVLDSAPRAYTVSGVASMLDCASVARDPICAWLMAEPNSDFIDIHPEAALKMAWSLKLADISRAAFRILVVEKALGVLSTRPCDDQYTVFGRPREGVPEAHDTAIQYASYKFADRVRGTYNSLCEHRPLDVLDISEYQRLLRIGSCLMDAIRKDSNRLDNSPLREALDCQEACVDGLNEYMRNLVTLAMSPMDYGPQHHLDQDRRCYVPRSRWADTRAVYRGLRRAQRLLIPEFWESLDVNVTRRPSVPVRVCRLMYDFNTKLGSALECIPSPLLEQHNIDLLRPHFDVSRFIQDLTISLHTQYLTWARPTVEVPLNRPTLKVPLGRTRHLVLALLDDEFDYLPLWAGGLDDGTGGAFESSVPDAELGPVGPGPAYHTGITVATDVSSICQSEKTLDNSETGTLTVGRSLAAALSNAESNVRPNNVWQGVTHPEPTQVTRAPPSGIADDETLQESWINISDDDDVLDEDDFDSDQDDEKNGTTDDEDVWSEVEAPLGV